MHDLKQVQPVADAQGRVVSLIGLDGHGRVYYGELTGTGRAAYKIEWKMIEEQ